MAALEGHTHVVHMCAWSPDGARLASASYDDTVRVWLAPAPAMTPMLTDDYAGDAAIPTASLEAAMARLGRFGGNGGGVLMGGGAAGGPGDPMPPGAPNGLRGGGGRSDEQRQAADRPARDARVANAHARLIAGDLEALRECSVEVRRCRLTLSNPS